MWFSKAASGNKSRRIKRSRQWLERIHTLAYRGLRLEPLEERRLLDATARTLSGGDLVQNWSNPNLISADNNWNGVPSIIGYAGAGLATSPGINPQTILGPASDVYVKATPSLTNQNQVVGEFDGIENKTVALQGSSAGTNAPSLVLHLNTTGRGSINVSYNLRDIDDSADDAIQQFALQYRIGATGNFINVPAGYVADATEKDAATKVTPVNVTLPADVNDKPLVQVRIITADAVGNDEWVGVDDITVTSGPLVMLPSVNISDETLEETDSERLFTLPLVLSAAAPNDVYITYETADGTAVANEDYAPVTRTAMIPTGGISTTISLVVLGDVQHEEDESYFVNITNVTGGTIGDGQAQVTILNDDPPPAAMSNVGLDPSGNLVVMDSDGNSVDVITIQADTANNRFIVTDANRGLTTAIPGATGDGTNQIYVPFSAVTGPGIVINTLGGDDIVTLDYSLGDFGKNILFDGGVGGNDGLRFVGSGTQTAVYQPSSTTFGDGQVTIGGGTVTFTGLEPMDFTGMATFTLMLPGAADTVFVDEGFDFATGATPALVITGFSGDVPVAFEAAHVFGNTTVVIDTSLVADGNDRVVISGAANGHDNANLTIITGAGSDDVNVNGAIALAGDLSVISQSVSVIGAISTNLTANAGDVTLVGSTEVTLVGGISTNAATTDGNVLVASGSELVVFQPIDAGSGVVRLVGHGDIGQAPTGPITAGTLGVRNLNVADGSIALVFAANDVDTFAAFSAFGSATDAIAFADVDGLTIDMVAAEGLFAATNGVSLGVPGVALLQAGGALAINAPINTSAFGAVGLVAAGDMTQNAAGLITSDLLGVRNLGAAGNIVLTQNNDVNTLSGFNAAATGTIQFLDADNLSLGATPGVTLGSISIPVMNGITASGGILVTTADGAGVGQNLQVNGGATVRSTAGNVSLNAGDNISVLGTVQSDIGTIFLNGDTGNADAGTGATISVLTGVLNAPLGGADLSGGPDSDVFDITPSLTTAISVAGNAPLPPTLPGDRLNLNLTGVPTPTLHPTGQGAGTFTFGGGYLPVQYTGIESLDATAAPYDVIIDMGPAGLNRQDGTADTITAQLNAAGTMLEILVSGLGIIFTGDVADVRSLTVLGSTDADTLIIQENAANLLPGEGGGFGGSAVGSHVNGSLTNSGRAPNFAAIHFDGGAGAAVDSLRMNFVSTQDVAYFSDAVDTANSGNVNVLGAFTLSFESLTPMILSGAGGPLLIDASSTPATTQLTISDDVANTAGAGGNMVTGDGGLETTFFRGFSNVTVRGGGGAAETITLASLDPASTETAIALDGDDLTNTDLSSDTIIVQSLPATVTATLLGGQGNDLFLLDSNGLAAGGTVDNILGQVIVSPVGDEGGLDTLTVNDDDDATGDTVSINATQIDGITGSAGVDIVYSNIDTLNLDTGSGDDTLNITATLAGTLYAVNTQGGGDTVNISSDAPANLGSLNAIDGQINLSTGLGVDTLNVSDAGDASGDTYLLQVSGATTRLLFADGAAAVDIVYDAVGGAGQLEFFNLTTSDTGADSLNIDNTTATTATVISSGGGNDGWAILAHNLQANNTFHGNAGSDSFSLTLAAGQTVTATGVVINGNDPVADTLPNQDQVTLAILGTRVVGLAYQAAGNGDVNITGLGTMIDINSTERVLYQGDAAADDTLTVTGVAGVDDDLSVIPTSATSAQVFRGGDPFDGPPETSATSRPGSLNGPGASFGPDLSLQGVAGLTLSGGTAGAAGNRLYVYGQSESDLVNANGVTYVPGVADARDVINVTDSQVTITNATLGALLPVNIAAGSFVQADPTRRALIVNSGDEAAPGPGGIADDITVLLSSLLSIQINGGDPLPGFAPNGDQLHVVTPADVHVFSDKNSPTNVTITSGNTLQLGFSSIERTLIRPGSGVVHLIGDNNDAGVDQNDNFVVVGADVDGDPLDGGVGEFSLSINDSAPIFFDAVQFLNVLGDDLALTPSAGPNDIDTLELTPYADNTPRGWGVQVSFNEGNPVGMDGAQADLLIYNTVAAHAVSENIIVQPSGLEAGELRVTNASDGSAIVTVSYINNLDIVVNDSDGFLSDTDSLILRGTDPGGPNTTGDESVTIDLTAAGTPVAPMVTFEQIGGGGGTLYRLRSFSNFNQLNIETLGGVDLVTVRAGRDDGSVEINIDGGLPGGLGQSDRIAVEGTSGAGDSFLINRGGTNDAGRIAVFRSTAAAETVINFTATERIEIDGLGGAGSDTLGLEGSGDDDVFSLTGTGTLAGVARVNAGPTIAFTSLGSGGSVLLLNGVGGDDSFAIAHVPNWQIDDVMIFGGPPSASDAVEITGTGDDDTFVYTASGANSGQIDVTSGGATTNYILSDVESASIFGLGQIVADSLDVTTANATIVPGAPGAGVVHPVSAGGAALLSLSYAGIESVAATGAAVVIEGTNANDTIHVSPAGIVTITNLLGFNNTFDASGFASLVINALGGDDNITIDSGALFAGGIRVIGGEPGAGSDSLTVTGTAGDDNIAIDLAASLVSGVIGGPIDLDGIEHLTIDGAGAAAGDNVDVNNYGALTSLATIQINANNLADTLDVSGTAAADTINFSAASAGDGIITRNGSATTIGFANLTGAKTILGSGGFDVLAVLGTEGADTVTTTASTVTLTGTVTIGAGIERLDINTFGGDDTVTLTGLALATIVDAGAGNDTVTAAALNLGVTLLGGSGDDTLTGGSGGDRIEGGAGNDTLAGGAGNDQLFGGDDFDVIDPGTGSDDVNGGAGSDDWLLITTSATDIVLRESAGRLRVEHGGNVVLASDISQALFNATGAATTMTVLDLSGTDVDRVGVDFNDGGTASELIVEGTAAADNIGVALEVTNPGGNLFPTVALGWGRVVAGIISAPQGDRIVVRSLGGDDTVVAAQNVMDGSGDGSALVTLDGGDGNDTLTAHTPAGQAGNRLVGGAGNDTLVGGAGDDEMDGSGGDDLFLGNGGTDAVGGGLLAAVGDAIVVPGSAGNDDISLALDGAGRLVVTINGVTTTYSNFVGGPIATAGIERILVDGGDGNDTLTVNSAGGALPIAISFDGGAGNDGLVLTGGVATSNIYSVGPNPGQGTSAIVIGGVTQLVTFSGLEPVVDLVAGPLTIVATAADNAINYSQGSVAANGLVTIDNFESIEFSGKTTLTIDAGAGNDTISLNNPSATPPATSVVIDGGDPADHDRLIVHGLAGIDDNFFVNPTAAGSGTVTKLGGPHPTVTYSGLEQLSVVGQSSDADTFQYTATAGDDTFHYTPGATADAASVTGFASSGVPFAFVPVAIEGIAGSVYLGSGGGNGVVGGADTVVLNGTAGDDTFSLPNPVGVFASPSVTVDTGANQHTPVLFNSNGGAATVILRGLGGNDQFNLDFNPLLPAADVGLRIEGGDGDDAISHTANTGAATTIDLGASSIISTGANTVTFAGVEQIDQVSSGAATLSVVGTGNDDLLHYMPATVDSGAVTLASTGLAINFSGVAGAFGLDGAGGSDTIVVSGNNAANVIDVSGTQVSVVGLKAVNVAAEALRVLGLAGSDEFNVTAGTTPIFIDGGDPIGATPGDQLNILSGGNVVQFNAGPENDEGSLVVGALQPISFDHIETIGPIIGAPSATINGTNANDAITIIARDSSFNPLVPGLDGVQDFTVSVNGSPTLLFINTPVLTVNALAGSDEIAVQTPAPNLAVWNVAVTIDGGLPTGSDTVIFGTPGTDTVQYTPTGADSGTLNIVNLASVTVLAGIEHLVYDGEGGNDSLTINGTAGDDTIVHTPGAQVDAGNVAVNSLLAIGYQNLGLVGSLLASAGGGDDELVVEGTAGNDIFAKLAAGGVSLTTGAGTHLAVQSTGVEQVTLAGLQGNDTADLTGDGSAVTLASLGTTVPSVSGGGLGTVNLSGVEILNLGAANAAVTVTTTNGDDTLDISPTGPNGATLQANGVSPLVNVASAASLAVNMLGGDDLLQARYTSNPETIDVNVQASTIGVSVGGPLLGIGFAGVDAIEVYGAEGNDTFNVTPGLVIPVFIDGGDPIGSTAGDRINILGGLASIFEPGPENDEGGFNFGVAAERVSFDHIEAVTIIGAMCVIVLGTNGDDDITVIARDDSYIIPPAIVPPGLDGVQDFTVSVNNGLEILYVDATMLYIDALAGDDDIVLRTPAPNNAVWDVDVWVAGGAPSAATGDQGDVFELETPGQQTVTFTPDGSDSGVIDIVTLSSVITLGTFVDACPPLNYDSSEGGLEAFVYDGEGADDLFSVIGTGGDDTIVHTPGSAADEGAFRVNNLLAVSYQNLGLAATINIDGAGGNDALVYHGTAGNDQFTVTGNAIGLVTNLTINHLDLAQTSIESLLLNGFAGDDSFTIDAAGLYALGIEIHGGEPSGSDHVTLLGTAGVDTIVLTMGAAVDTVTGVVAGPVALVGVENLTVNSLAGDDALGVVNVGDPTDLNLVTLNSGGDTNDTVLLTGGAGPDAIIVTPLSATSISATAGVGPTITANLAAAATSTFTVGGGDGSDRVTVQGTAGNDAIGITRGATTTVQVGGSKQVNVTTATTEALSIAAGLGNDTITVDGAGGPALDVDGGQPNGNDLLQINNTAAGTTTVSPGATVDAGTITTPDGIVAFAGLELITLVASAGADTLVTQGTNGADEFALQFLGGANRVWIDGRAVVSFSAFETVDLQGRFGDDKFSVSPDGLMGVTTINVVGGDPTASDELVVTGTAAAETILFTPTGVDAGSVTVGAAPIINFNTTESLVIDGAGGNDTLSVNAPATSDTIHVRAGTTIDAGSVRINSLIEASFKNLGATGLLNVIDAGGSDTLVYDGTTANDSFSVNGAAIDLVTLLTNNHIDVVQNGVEALVLNAFDGDDQFTIAASAQYVGGITIWAGDPSASDSVLLLGTAGNDAINVTLGVAGDVVTGVVGGPINLVDVEHLTVASGTGDDALSLTGLGGTTDLDTVIFNSGGDAADTLSITGTAGADTITVQPTSATRATVSANGVGPLVTANLGVAATSLLNILGGANSDDLIVEGSASADIIAASGAAVVITGLKTVNFAQFEALSINGHQGNDAFTVTPSLTLPIFVDGGDPIGVNLPGDSLSLVTGGNPIAFFAGPESDEGGFLIGANAEVSFDHIETIGPIIVGPGPGPVLIVGTNGDDDITVIARDSGSTPQYAGADGVQDFTVSVNQGPDILFINAPTLFVDALSGDDDVVVRAPAPNNVPWQVTVNVVGGPPSASDTLVFETPGQDTVIFTPTGSDTGTLRIDEAPLGPVADLQDSVINILSTFTIPFPAFTYVSSPGGIEHLFYDGENGADTLQIVGTVNSDTVVHTPGLAGDEGTLRVNNLLGISYQNLGLTAPAIVIDGGIGGSDRLVYDGTDGNDAFTVAATGTIDLANNVGNHVDLAVVSIEALTLDAKNGDDTFVINGSLGIYLGGIIVAAGDPSGSDLATLNGTAGADAISLTLGAAGDQVSGVVGGLVNLVGVENLTINSLAGNDAITVNNVGGVSDLDFVTLNLGGDASDVLTATGTANDDRIIYTPTSTTGGNFLSESSPTLFTFTQGAAATSTFTINALGGAGDEVIVQGTNSHDVITVDSPNRTVTVENASGMLLKPVSLGITVETVTSQGRLGNDTFHVIPARRQPFAPPDVPVGPGFTLPTNLLVNIDGGAPGASDALVIAGPGGAILASDLFVVVNRGRDADEGVVRIFQDQPGAGNEPFQFPDITYTDVELVSPVPFVNAAGDPNLLILGADLYEQNEFRANAAFLGSGSALNVVNVSIFPNAFEHRFVQADQDYFRVVAQQTGTLDFQVYFKQLNEFLPGRGNLQIEVLDADGTVIAGSGPNFGTNDGPGDFSVDDERIRIPVVAGQTYYLRVFGLVNATVNAYSISVQNLAPPVPFDIELDDYVALSSVTAGFSVTQFNGGAGLSDIDGYYNGKFLTFTSGALIGQRALITTYTAATRTFAFASGSFSGIPQLGDAFLVESGDTGRSQFENTTRDNTPTIFLRLDDAIFLNDLPGNGAPGAPPDEVIAIPFNPSTAADSLAPGYRVAIFDETDTHNPVLLGFAQPVLGQPGVYMFTFAEPLVDGSHFISARVQIIDPASPTQRGFGARSLSAEIVVDTGLPPVAFGSLLSTIDGLDPSSDSGVPGFPATFTDRITSDTTPALFGVAEANSIVRVYEDRNANGIVDLGDVFLGQTVANPLDGSNQLPGGQWTLTTIVDLNNPAFFPKDGTRRLLATAEDLAGNVTPATGLTIFIDTQGPQITNVAIPTDPFFDLFDPKPSQDGATPLVFSLSIGVRDLPNRDTINFPGYLALLQQVAEQPGHYVVRGDHVGVIAVQSVQVVFGPDLNGLPATATIVLNFGAPLPDDRFTLTISDAITDPANNRLDGENNAIQPLESPLFPSGDGTPGGGFVARFTVDSRPEIGTYAGTTVYLDTNGNFLFDPTGVNNDTVNHDIVYSFGSVSDQIFAGKFGPAPLTGRYFDQLGAYGQFGGSFRWLIDLNSDGVVDVNNIQPTPINGVAVAGNFDGNPFNGDEIGLFDGTAWYRDLNRNFIIEPNEGRINSTMPGYPIVGDFDGDGVDDLGTFNANVFYFDLAANGLSGNADATVAFGFPGVSERPVAADMDQDGIDDIGLWIPGNLGQTDAQTTEWHFLVSNDRTLGDGVNDRVIGTVNTLNHTFTPVPFGADLFARFGDEPAFPVVGNFDPPIGNLNVPSTSNEIVVVGAGAGGAPRVRVLNHATGQAKLDFLAYNAGFAGGVNVATGDVNGDGVLDIITGAGPGGGPHVRVFDGRDGAPLGGTIGNFFAYNIGFFGGVNVASADMNGDGKADIITAAGAGGGPHVRIFSGADGSLLGEYFAFDFGFRGGVNVAVGDVDGDTVPDVIAGAGASGGPHVRVFSGATSQQVPGPLGNFFAYSVNFTGGVYVAAGDLNGDGRADIITGAGASGGPHVIAIDAASGGHLANFFAYAANFTGGVRVAAVDLNRDGRADIVTGAGPTGGPHIRGFAGLTGQPVFDTFGFEAGFRGGVFVAGGAAGIGGASLVAAEPHSAVVHARAESISDEQLQRIVAAAIGRWEQGGLSPAEAARMRSIDVRLADLSGARLGLAYDDLILIDADAAGFGWFVDATPDDDEEFSPLGRAITPEAASRMDLLSALAHEFGHVLGLDDLDHDLDPGQIMADALAAGLRRTPSTKDVDDVFSSDDWQ